MQSLIFLYFHTHPDWNYSAYLFSTYFMIGLGLLTSIGFIYGLIKSDSIIVQGSLMIAMVVACCVAFTQIMFVRLSPYVVTDPAGYSAKLTEFLKDPSTKVTYDQALDGYVLTREVLLSRVLDKPVQEEQALYVKADDAKALSALLTASTDPEAREVASRL